MIYRRLIAEMAAEAKPKKKRKRIYKPQVPGYKKYDPDAASVSLYSRSRNPFKHFQHKTLDTARQPSFLGPGPSGYIHVRAKVPWNCNVVPGEKYHYICIKRDPESGEVIQKKRLKYDPVKKQQRNERYRSRLKAHLEGLKSQLQGTEKEQLAMWRKLGATKIPVRFASDSVVRNRYVSPGYHS